MGAVTTIIIGWNAVWFPQADNHHQTALNVRMKKSDTPVSSMLTRSVAYNWIPFNSSQQMCVHSLFCMRHRTVFLFSGLWMLSWETAVCGEDQTGWGGSTTKAGLRGTFPTSAASAGLPVCYLFSWLSFPCPTPLPPSLTICWGKDWGTLTVKSQVFSWEILKRSCNENHMQNEQIMSPLGHLGKGVSESHS